MALALTLAVLMGMTVGCAKKKQIPLETDPYEDQVQTGPRPEGEGSGLPDVELERLLWDEYTGLQKVYFAYDSFALSPQAQATLKDNAAKIKQAPGVMIQIEGHCDERGTQEYNLALGEKRALAVRDYLIQLGIAGNRLVTISYGEEDPAVLGHDEAAWSKNRRAEFNKARGAY